MDDSNEDMPDTADSRPPEGLYTELAKSDDARKKTDDEKADGEQNIGEVVALDAFRKNKT